MSDSRVYQAGVEVVHTGGGSVRAYTVAVEAVTPQVSSPRPYLVAVEVIRSINEVVASKRRIATELEYSP